MNKAIGLGWGGGVKPGILPPQIFGNKKIKIKKEGNITNNNTKN
jgi:hypothetical protein